MFNLLQATIEVATETAPEAPFLAQFQPFFFIAIMVLVMWLFIWRPENKRRKEQAAFRDALKKGDKVITAGGIHATIKEVNDTTLLIEVDSNVTLRIEKTMVSAIPSATPEQK